MTDRQWPAHTIAPDGGLRVRRRSGAVGGGVVLIEKYWKQKMLQVIAVGRPELSSFDMPDRFRTDVTYFITPKDDPDVPELQPGEHWIRLDDAKKWLDEFVVQVVSPLSAEVKAEIELTEEQEAWLEWMVENGIQHIRVSAKS
ncbi:MAG: hypothetical protein KDB27_03355 [Planctomycetales bacterium]|nr:hypothetical protein [Planctomycetales bacterium]